MTAATGTAAYLNGGAPVAAAVPRSAAGIIAAAGRGIAERVRLRARGALGGLAELGAGGAFTYGAFQLPGHWSLTGWAVAGLALLITGAKLNP